MDNEQLKPGPELFKVKLLINGKKSRTLRLEINIKHISEEEMKCPTCPEETLVMADRQGIEIDYCPKCRGVWLDRGELDKLIEKSVSSQISTSGRQAVDIRDSKDDYRKDHYHKRRKSFLSEIFD